MNVVSGIMQAIKENFLVVLVQTVKTFLDPKELGKPIIVETKNMRDQVEVVDVSLYHSLGQVLIDNVYLNINFIEQIFQELVF